MRGIISLPFRFVRAGRFGLIAVGAGITGLGLWLQINGVPPGVDPVIAGLNMLLSPVVDPQHTVFGLLSKVGGVMALLGLLGMTLHDIAPAGAKIAEADDDLMSTFAPEPAPAKPAQSTWQERLAAKSDTTPVAQAAKSRSIGSVLRKTVVGLVICAFLAVLGATIYGQMNGGAVTATQATAQPSTGRAMVQAHLAQAGAIAAPASAAPSSTPAAMAFDIPKFDPATIVPWVKDQLARALAGDQAAMINLGSIVGGIFVLMLGIKIIFARKRGKARAQIRQMGYN
jgi:hypothetical protein